MSNIIHETVRQDKQRHQSAQRIKLLPAPVPLPRIVPKRLSYIVYVLLPRSLSLHPPIRHLHGTSPLYATPFEFAIAAALVTAARAMWSDRIHDASFMRGQRRIAEGGE